MLFVECGDDRVEGAWLREQTEYQVTVRPCVDLTAEVDLDQYVSGRVGPRSDAGRQDQWSVVVEREVVHRVEDGAVSTHLYHGRRHRGATGALAHR